MGFLYFYPMRILNKIADNVVKLEINKLLKGIYELNEFQALVIDLNTNEQLFEGINSENKKLSDIGGEYSAFTVEIKEKKNQPTDRVTLKDTGDFYDSFSVRSTNDGFIIMANTLKEDNDLTDSWGEEIIGLTELSRSQVIFYLTDEIIPKVREAILRGVQ